jgi:LPXTG-motif cell wall-anchored protein
MYIDPNTGGMLFNVLAGLLAVGSGVLLYFSRNIREAIAKLRRRFRKDEGEPDK